MDRELISKWPDSFKRANLDQIKNYRRMFGWVVVAVSIEEPVSFIKDTILIIKNNGITAITQDIDLETKTTNKYQISVTGDLGIKGSGSKKTFKYGLDSAIKVKVDDTTTVVETKKYSTKIYVDPGTMLMIREIGTGKISQGYGGKFFFYRITRHGAYEQFTLQTKYYDIVKVEI